ncbi:MAG: hypothetical protein ACKO96_00120, partial [Flammeovirgaceae bacterium]
MEANGAATNGNHLNGVNGIGHINGTITKVPKKNNYPEFTLREKLTEEQKNFFEKNGFIHFKSFITREHVARLLRETERIQQEWVSNDYKMINGVPIKYGTDIDGKKIVQRFAFV